MHDKSWVVKISTIDFLTLLITHFGGTKSFIHGLRKKHSFYTLMTLKSQ